MPLAAIGAIAGIASAGVGIAGATGAFSPDAPEQRSAAQESYDTLMAQIRAAPDVYKSEAEYRPKYTALQSQLTRQSLLGDANGKGLLDLYENYVTPAQSRMQAATQGAQRTSDIADVTRLGPEAMAAMRSVDPARAALLDSLTSQAQDELSLGTNLDPSMSRLIQQSVRSGQSARGFGYSPTDVFQEVLATGQFGQNLRNQRRTFASSVVNQRGQAYGDPFLQILGRPSTTSGPQSYGAQGQSASSTTPQLFDPFSQYGQNLNSQNYSAQQQAAMAAYNTRMAGIGGGLSALGSITGALGKYGTDSAGTPSMPTTTFGIQDGGSPFVDYGSDPFAMYGGMSGQVF
jgi:hypothetical protein